MSSVVAAPWNARDVAQGVAFAVLGGAGLVAAAFGLRAALDLGDLTVLLLTSAALSLVLLAAGWRCSVGKYGLPLESLGFRRVGVGRLWLYGGAGLLGVVLLTSAYVAVTGALGLPLLEPPPLPAPLRESTGVGRLAAAFGIIVLGPIAEETFFRGFVYQGLTHWLGPLGAAAASSALFAAAHGSVGLLAPVFLAGLALTWVFVRTRSLAPAILAHSLQNALAFASAL